MYFKKTVNFSELKSDPSLFSKLKDGEVFQVIHRGSEIKVMMTQEHYLTLMSRLEKAEGASKLTPFDPSKLMSEVDDKIAKMRDSLKVKQKNVG